MKVFPLAMVFATLAVIATGPVFAGSTIAEKNYENIQQEWDKARAAGGYGIPFVAVPMAVVAAFVGDERQEDTVRMAAKKAG